MKIELWLSWKYVTNCIIQAGHNNIADCCTFSTKKKNKTKSYQVFQEASSLPGHSGSGQPTLMVHSESGGDQVKVMNGWGGQQMGFEREKIATFPGDISCPRNQASALEEPVSFSQLGGRVSSSIGSTRLNLKPFTSKHWSMWTSRLHHCCSSSSFSISTAAWNVSTFRWISITRPSGN